MQVIVRLRLEGPVFPRNLIKVTLLWLPRNCNSILLVQALLRGDVTETILSESLQLVAGDALD